MVGTQALDVIVDIAQFEHLHAAFDPAQEGAFLVAREIVPELVAQDLTDRLPRPGDTVAIGMIITGADVERAEASCVFDQLAGHVLDRDLQIDRARGDHAGGHVGIAGRGAICQLRDRQPALFLDRLDPERAVMTGAGQDHGDRILGAILGQRREKDVDRVELAPTGRTRVQARPAAPQCRYRGRHENIDVVRLDRAAVAHRGDRQRGRAAQDLRKRAFVALAEMGDDDKCHPRVRRHRPEKGLQRFDASGGGANAHHEKAIIGQAADLCRFSSRLAN
jgi:hypothetical protein